MAKELQYGFFRDVELIDGRMGVVEHAHQNNVNVHLHLTGISADADFIFVDLDDTTNYPHVLTGYTHIENVWFDMDASNTAEYEITLGFLKNVSAATGDFVHLYTISGGKQAGNSKIVVLPLSPNGAKMDSRFVVTHDVITSATYGSSNSLPSTLDPMTANVNPDNGDLVLRIIINAGSIAMSLNASYHTHN